MTPREVFLSAVDEGLRSFYAEQPEGPTALDVIWDCGIKALADAGWSVVRLPERRPEPEPVDSAYPLGWNDCLDEIERLSG